MLPLRDVIPSRTAPSVTLSLIAVNVLVFFVQSATSSGPRLIDVFFTWGFVPAEASFRALVTSMFVHSGLVHLVSNMAALWLFGGTLEDRLGHLRFLGFFLTTGAVAALAERWMAPTSATPLVGSSGAVAGLVGAYLAFFPRSRILTLVPIPPLSWDVVEMPAAILMVLWLGLELLGGFSLPTGGPFAAVGALGAGLAVGPALVWLLRRPDRRRVEWWAG